MACKDCGWKCPEEIEYEKEGKPVSAYHMFVYGVCPKCTPKKLNALIEQVHEVRIDAGREWDVKMAEKKKAYINKKSAKFEKKALKLYNDKRPEWYAEKTKFTEL